MSVYIKTKEESLNALTHYGIKGMKWRHHKKRAIYDGAGVQNLSPVQQNLTQMYVNAHQMAEDQKEIDELKKKNKGPISHKKPKASGKAKRLYRRKALHNVWSNAGNHREISNARQFLKNYIGITKAYYKGKKAKNAAKLGMRYIKTINKGLKDYMGE